MTDPLPRVTASRRAAMSCSTPTLPARRPSSTTASPSPSMMPPAKLPWPPPAPITRRFRSSATPAMCATTSPKSSPRCSAPPALPSSAPFPSRPRPRWRRSTHNPSSVSRAIHADTSSRARGVRGSRGGRTAHRKEDADLPHGGSFGVSSSPAFAPCAGDARPLRRGTRAGPHRSQTSDPARPRGGSARPTLPPLAGVTRSAEEFGVSATVRDCG
jgi:hypothetical protein